MYLNTISRAAVRLALSTCLLGTGWILSAHPVRAQQSMDNAPVVVHIGDNAPRVLDLGSTAPDPRAFPANWTSPQFDDSYWASASPITSDVQTCDPNTQGWAGATGYYGPAQLDYYAFRQTFQLPPGVDYYGSILNIGDGGQVIKAVYINGYTVFDANISPPHDTFAQPAIGQDLQSGQNVIAIYLDPVASSDNTDRCNAVTFTINALTHAAPSPTASSDPGNAGTGVVATPTPATGAPPVPTSASGQGGGTPPAASASPSAPQATPTTPVPNATDAPPPPPGSDPSGLVVFKTHSNTRHRVGHVRPVPSVPSRSTAHSTSHPIRTPHRRPIRRHTRTTHATFPTGGTTEVVVNFKYQKHDYTPPRATRVLRVTCRAHPHCLRNGIVTRL